MGDILSEVSEEDWRLEVKGLERIILPLSSKHKQWKRNKCVLEANPEKAGRQSYIQEEELT